MHIIFPNVFAFEEAYSRNPISQLAAAKTRQEGKLVSYSRVRPRLEGYLFQPDSSTEEILILPNGKTLPDGHFRILQANIDPALPEIDLSDGAWLRHPLRTEPRSVNHGQEIQKVLESWQRAFSYVQEDPDRHITGLRNPQIGAVHAVHAHWSVSSAVATVVMPTGTGKTETMLSILISGVCEKLLVVVPTDTLRTQLADKFLTLGVLKKPGCAILQASARYPIVCSLKHVPRDEREIDTIFERSQVIVTTSSIAGLCGPEVQDRMAYHCPYLFIDEAHHAEAPTWSDFKEKFRARRVLQFTATPFREDGKPLDGKIIFSYPLRKAQQENYFTPIKFKPVIEFNRKRSDMAIAAKAVEQLREDLDKGHILMARVSGVERAREVFQIYSQYPELHPVQLHTGIKSHSEREKIRRELLSGQSRIVVCVDMLGEGFDLPELKIAAFHDIRKTLAVTLQIAGRFTRARPDLGRATFIANTAEVDVQEELRKLYTRDPDWNALLPDLSETMIGEQMSLQEFLHGFTQFTEEIPLKSVQPATSAVVYRTNCSQWTPDNFRDGIPAINSCEQVHHALNVAANTLIIVTARRLPLVWTNVSHLFSWDWELYVLIWASDQNLLFINSSTNTGEYRALAHAVVGDTATLIKGQDVFRTFAGVRRLRLQNVGLTEQLGRNVRYTGRMGADVESGLGDVQRRRARKSVLAGSGYENGQKATVGASRKGRIWSHRRERVDKLVEWCKMIGGKLLDERIDPDEVLRGTLEAKSLTQRPAQMPISADWPEIIYTAPEMIWSVLIDGHEYHVNELSLEVCSPSLTGGLRLAIASDDARVEIDLEFFTEDENPNYRFAIDGDKRVEIQHGRTTLYLAEFFYLDPPVIWFADGSSLEGNEYVELKTVLPPYNAANIQAWNWTGVNLTKESQGEQKEQDSVQAAVIRELKSRNYQMIIDDDGKGEVADVVAIQLIGEASAPSQINVEFYHCKFSQAATPGQRIKDLYEVCGQAQKSIVWVSSPDKKTEIFTHLLRREARRQEAGSSTRYELGDGDLLHTIREMSHLTPILLKIFIVQPGVSKASATRSQLELLSVTENYLMETYQIGFGVIGSP